MHIWQRIIIKNQTDWRSRGDQQEQERGGDMFNTQCVFGWKHNTNEYSIMRLFKKHMHWYYNRCLSPKMTEYEIPDWACWYIHISFSLQSSVPDAYRNLTFIFYFFSPMAFWNLSSLYHQWKCSFMYFLIKFFEGFPVNYLFLCAFVFGCVSFCALHARRVMCSRRGIRSPPPEITGSCKLFVGSGNWTLGLLMFSQCF